MAELFSSEQKNYEQIDLNDSLEYQRHIHASHVIFWCKDYRQSPVVTYALMQLRRDGLFGFPGGKSDENVIDKNEILKTLCRELDEEINYKSCNVTIDDHLFSHIGIEDNIVLHFFGKELLLEEFEMLERTHMNARDFPEESLGLFRVPLSACGQQTFKPVMKFFSGFAKQKFAGNAKNQLFEAIIKLNLMTQNDVKEIEKLFGMI
jgi:8-oxo-dGTP pyrophosphatase MutT (NUDIX family)